MKDHINKNIKFREDFRPFAPAVPAEHAATYFDGGYASPYMLLVAPARPEHADSIRDVTHVDGSCRLQTVSPAEEPTFHALLTTFARRTGLPVLLNTSFNRRGMPIVETPGEAIDFFLELRLGRSGDRDFYRPETEKPRLFWRLLLHIELLRATIGSQPLRLVVGFCQGRVRRRRSFADYCWLASFREPVRLRSVLSFGWRDGDRNGSGPAF